MNPFDNIVVGNRTRTIAYTSECLLPEAKIDQAFLEIALQSLGSNELAGINSVLFYDQHRFYQLIEGPDHAVRHLFGRIEADTRHGKLRLLIDQQSSEPGLPGTSMQAYLIDCRTVSEDPAYARMKEGFKELCAGDIRQSRTIVDFTRTMMTTFDQYLVLR